MPEASGAGRIELIEGDIADPQVAGSTVAGCERVFHLAALADIVPSIQQPAAYFRANVDGTFAVLEAARTHGVRRLVYVASSSCYGIPSVYPTPETTPRPRRWERALSRRDIRIVQRFSVGFRLEVA